MNDLSWSQCLMIAAFACAAFCFGATLPRSVRRLIQDLCGVALMIPILAILAVMATFACICASIGIAIVARREIKRGRARAYRVAAQRRAWRAIEGQFEAIRRERGVDEHGRVKRAVRNAEPSDLPYASVVSLHGHPSRKQAG